MKSIDLIAQIIFTGFGWSVFFSCLLSVYKNEKFQKYNLIFSNTAVEIIRLAGIFWFLIILFQIGSAFNEPYIEGADTPIANRMFGPYWFIYWIWFLSFCIAPQLLWIAWLRKSTPIRMFIAILILLVKYSEQVIIFVTAYSRDYLPNGLAISYEALIFDALLKIACFVLFVFIIATVKGKPKQKAYPVLDEEN